VGYPLWNAEALDGRHSLESGIVSCRPQRLALVTGSLTHRVIGLQDPRFDFAADSLCTDTDLPQISVPLQIRRNDHSGVGHQTGDYERALLRENHVGQRSNREIGRFDDHRGNNFCRVAGVYGTFVVSKDEHVTGGLQNGVLPGSSSLCGVRDFNPFASHPAHCQRQIAAHTGAAMQGNA